MIGLKNNYKNDVIEYNNLIVKKLKMIFYITYNIFYNIYYAIIL